MEERKCVRVIPLCKSFVANLLTSYSLPLRTLVNHRLSLHIFATTRYPKEHLSIRMAAMTLRHPPCDLIKCLHVGSILHHGLLRWPLTYSPVLHIYVLTLR